MPYLTQAGKAIQEARELCKLSQEELCEKVSGLNLYTLRKIERGEDEDLSVKMYSKIAEAFNIPVSFLNVLANIPDEMPSPQIIIQLQTMVRQSISKGDT